MLTDLEFKLISTLVYDKFGINLSDEKRTLIVQRLQKVVSDGGFNSFKEYYEYVIREPSGEAMLTLVDRISTNHTFFFREKSHFDYLTSNVFPQISDLLLKKGSRDLRIWCAGCSSGEEPYTLSILASEFFAGGYAMDTGILATDVSVTALEKAVTGIYQPGQFTQMPLIYRQKYFTPLKDGSWAVKQNIKDMVLFRRLNLMRTEYPFRGKFHMIFCRNVMIYFDKPTRQALIERFHRYTEPGGYLFIGHSETIDRTTGMYKYIQPAAYQKI